VKEGYKKVLKIEKKQVKIVSIVISAFFLLGIVGLAVSQGGKTYAAPGTSSNIGVVNYQAVLSQHPDMASAQETMKAEVDQAQKDFDAKSAGMNDTQKKEYFTQIQQRLNLKQQELLGAINDKVVAAVKTVAESKGLSVVLEKNNVIYGGQDITDEVVKKVTGK
jgi:outer membrane protein